MSTIKTAIELQVKQPSLKGFRQELKQLTLEAQQAVIQFGEFSPEAVKAAQRVAQLRDRMEDFNDRVAAVNPDKFAQLNTVVSSVANGFQAAQGAMVLLGGTTRNVEQTFIKLQAAMALSQGLEGLGKVQQQLKQIIASATTLQKVMAGTLGVIVLIVTNFQRIVQLIPGFQKVADILTEVGFAISDFFGLGYREQALYNELKKATELQKVAINEQLGLLSNQYGKEEEIFQKRKELIDADLKLTQEALRLKQYANEEEKFELERTEKEHIAALKVLEAEKTKVLEDGVRERTRQYEDYVDATTQLEIQRETENIQRLQTSANFHYDITAYSQGEQYKILKGAKIDQNQLLEREFENTKKILEQQRDTEIKELERKYEDQKRLLGDNQDEIEGLTTLHNERLTQVNALYATKEAKALEDKNKKKKEYEIQTDQQIRDAKLQIAQSTIDGLNALADITINNQDKLAKVRKGIALVEIAVDTGMAISSLNKEAATVSAQMAAITGPATPIFTAAYYAQGIARILANVAKAKQILSSKNASVGSMGGSGASPNISTPTPQMVSGSSLPEDTQGGKVYVLEGDIRRTQQRVGMNRGVSVVE